MPREALISLSLSEIEVMLLAARSRDGQDLGPYFAEARKKLSEARKELLGDEPETNQEKLFE